MKTIRLQWEPVPASLPPGAEDHWFSPHVWLALSDGRVVRGSCLHRCKDAEYNAPVHSWFESRDKGLDCHIDEDEIQVIAWMPFAKPDHPGYSIGMNTSTHLTLETTQ